MSRHRTWLFMLSGYFAFLLVTTPRADAQIGWTPPSIPTRVNESEQVVYDPNQFKYHKEDCIWAQRCTRNCEKVKRGEAIRRGGKPCQVCGG